MGIWGFLHFAGFAAWIGGGLASMFVGLAGRREERPALGTVVRLQWAITRTLVFPGAIATVVSGLMLTFRIMGSPQTGNGWLVLMQAVGLVGALLALFVTVPTSARLTRLDPAGPHAAFFDKLRARQRLMGAVSGVLGALALLGGALYRYGS